MRARVLLILVPLLLLGGCRKDDTEAMLERLLVFEPEPEQTKQDPERIAELKEGIEKYRQVVQEKVRAAGQLGVYYKLLAEAYMQQGMFGLALEALEEAITIYPENPVLFQMAGICAGRMAKAQMDPVERDRYLQLSESYYLRALDLDPRLKESLYGIAILYVFEMGRPEDAIPHLRKLVEIDPGWMEPYFVLARAYVEVGRIEEAKEEYRYVVEHARDREIKTRAQEHILQLSGGTE
ncbi:Tetratricopeptide TPR_1 repeat-containing protein [Spirochaeta thermophila DSM 6578]|uniref:Tetratricopeptide TPR_1 repeat-containing protein n=1 Tax=Winmispira thermophila (strain ATCC 700085 / DSM 6578 / Z-1203) TaxID=869211 RepID=G0GCB5_WINT7|nr:tetratricopeptide repeat protein [Spirochaeta thermophila]AEJ61200.1 Tetratricopeptide TPR_1 repeat-containing protein [Spirochaeta thermophila DSM 6578]